MQTEIKIENGTICIRGPFSADNNIVYRSAGGKFSGGCWLLPDTDTNRAKIVELFGERSDEVDALVPANKCGDGQQVQIGGYVLAERRERDWIVKMPDGVSLESGEFTSSGGSVKNPRVNVRSGMVFRLRCRQSFAERKGLDLAENKTQIPEAERLAI